MIARSIKIGEWWMAQQGILKKTEIISVRIDSELSKKLHDKSEEQRISLNALINHLLEKQVHWNELANEIGYRIINDEYNRSGFSFEIVSIEVIL